MRWIGIIGTRRRDSEIDYRAIKVAFLNLYEKGDKIVSGGCPKGGDKFAERLAVEYNVTIKIHYAQWKEHGKIAGFIRNTEIAKDADYLIACVSEDRKGGTEDTIKKFLKNKSAENLIIV